MLFKLVSGRKVNKPRMAYCVAIKFSGRWHHSYYSSLRDAQQEIGFALNSPQHVKDEYGIENCRLIVGE